MMYEDPVTKKKRLPPWQALGVLHPVGVADCPRRIRQQREGQAEFIREGFLLGYRIHRDADDLNLVLGKCRECRPQRLHLLHSARGIRLRIEEHDRPRT